MNWKKELLKNFRLYAVTDLKEESSRIFSQVDQALAGGVDMVQLRAKTLETSSLLRIGKKLRQITLRRKKLFVMNDRVDLAVILGADGVHLGQEDLPTNLARKILKRDQIIGRSTHSLSQAVQAARDGADYIAFGPIYGTPTKPDYPAVGLGKIKQVMAKVKIPVVCIGGIDQTNLGQVLNAGARRVAVVRAIFGATDPRKAASDLTRSLKQ